MGTVLAGRIEHGSSLVFLSVIGKYMSSHIASKEAVLKYIDGLK